jgi:hypothetical protein
MPLEPRITTLPTQGSLDKQAVYDDAHGVGSDHSAPMEFVRGQDASSSERTNMPTGVTSKQSSLSTHDERMLRWVFSAYTVTATFWLLFATAVGVLMAYKFGAPDFARGEWLTFGRLRPIHTNATFYGWASLALVGLAYYVAARSSRTR